VSKLRFSADFQHLYAAFGVANLLKKLIPRKICYKMIKILFNWR